MTSFIKKYANPLIIISVIAVLGSGWLILTHAASPVVSFEAESSTISSPATKVSDSGASGGQAIKFGSTIAAPGPGISVWSPQFMGYGAVGPASDYHPEKFSIVAGKFSKSEITSFHSNGVKVVLVYINGSMKNAQDMGPNGDGTGTYPSSSYATTQSGQLIYPNAFPNNNLMNPVDPTWRNSLGKKCSYQITQFGYDGCIFDTIGKAPIHSGYVSPGLPYDFAKNQTWTATDWLAAQGANMDLAKSANPGKLIFGNGLASGPTYYDSSSPTSVLMSHLDGGMAEEFIKNATTTPNETTTNWLNEVKMLAQANILGKYIVTTTKSWESPAATQAQKDAWHMFALTTFLLGSNSHTYFSFQYDHTTTSPSTYQPIWSTDLGTPLGSYSQNGNVYERSFTKSRVIVNPSTSASATVNLNGNYRITGSSNVISSITLNPQTGVILIPS